MYRIDITHIFILYIWDGLEKDLIRLYEVNMDTIWINLCILL